MSESEPDLLLELVANKNLNICQDTLLGFCKYGACTTHWIEPGGDRQARDSFYRLYTSGLEINL